MGNTETATRPLRRATVAGAGVAQVQAYLPNNYEVVASGVNLETGIPVVVIRGRDVAGWTLDGYVIPRLASGLIWAEEA